MTFTGTLVSISNLPANGGSAVFESSGTLGLATSDRRLKKNIKPIMNALDKIKQLNGVEFDWKYDEHGNFNKDHQIGVIAQDVIKVFPEAVYGAKHEGKAVLGVGAEKLIGPLIEAVKELSNRIDQLEEV
jgi:hypothetical protein